MENEMNSVFFCALTVLFTNSRWFINGGVQKAVFCSKKLLVLHHNNDGQVQNNEKFR